MLAINLGVWLAVERDLRRTGSTDCWGSARVAACDSASGAELISRGPAIFVLISMIIVIFNLLVDLLSMLNSGPGSRFRRLDDEGTIVEEVAPWIRRPRPGKRRREPQPHVHSQAAQACS